MSEFAALNVGDQLLLELSAESNWQPVRDGTPEARRLYERHYSCRHYSDGRRRMKIVGPGEYIMLMTADCRALFVWRKFFDASGQRGVNCAVFRKEGPGLASAMILDAEKWARTRWPGHRMYTYVNAHKIRPKRDPGRCFLKAGWRKCGYTKKGLVILAKESDR